MRLLMVATEYAPIAKTGGLADMVAGLAGALAARGHDVRVVLPRYRGLEREPLEFTNLGEPLVSPVKAGAGHPEWRLEALPHSAGQPRVYLADCPPLFGGASIYGDGEREALRFALLCHAALRLPRLLDWSPQVVHCHDWHASLAVLLLRGPYAADPHCRDAYSVLTLHNIGYQGIVPAGLVEDMGAGAVAHLWPAEGGTRNLLRAGITHADALTTVSPTHAEEIRTPAFGMGMDELLRHRSHRLVGILNGVDYGQWNPATDPHLPAPYSATDLGGKAACRARLRERAGLADAGATPLVGMVSRLASQKGIELVLGALPALLEARRLQAVVLGDGDGRYVQALGEMAARYPGRFGFLHAQDEGLARLVFAGSDAFLVPSLYEPCGLTQMYALRYGSVPVVRATGGLRDTIRHFDPATGEGNGAVFNDPDVNGLAWAIGEALAWHGEPATWSRLVANGMAADFSWAHQAPLYEALYARLAAGDPATGA